jgi:hypothetical protein
VKAALEAPSDPRVAALVHCMQARSREALARRNGVSLAFEGLAVSPSTWDTFSLAQGEVDRAGKHLHVALAALTRWLVHGA